MRKSTLFALLLCGACSSAQGSAGTRREREPGPACVDATVQACVCEDGSSGQQVCQAAAWGACACDPGPRTFGNPDASVQTLAGSGGGGASGGGGIGGLANCDPGFYLGQYNCDLDLNGFVSPLMGDVAFSLEIDEQAITNTCDAEFCPDLVIAESSGVLFGLAGFIGFEAKLQGGLDCTTGEFRASAPGGVWGTPISSDPADPNAPWTVQQPPQGMFSGELIGLHAGGTPQVIEGDWDLAETTFNAICAGPFSVTLQP